MKEPTANELGVMLSNMTPEKIVCVFRIWEEIHEHKAKKIKEKYPFASPTEFRHVLNFIAICTDHPRNIKVKKTIEYLYNKIRKD